MPSKLEIKQKLGLPDNLDGKRIRSRAIRECCAGGQELLDAKEWASGIATRSGDAVARKIGAEALRKLEVIEAALITALEATHGLPPGSITH